MAKNKSLLLAGLAAGAYAYFRKKENRDKAMEAFNNTKNKVNSFMEAQKQQDTSNENTGNPNPYHEEDNRMVDEGAMTSVQYYNEEEQVKDDIKTTPDNDAKAGEK